MQLKWENEDMMIALCEIGIVSFWESWGDVKRRLLCALDRSDLLR